MYVAHYFSALVSWNHFPAKVQKFKENVRKKSSDFFNWSLLEGFMVARSLTLHCFIHYPFSFLFAFTTSHGDHARLSNLSTPNKYLFVKSSVNSRRKFSKNVTLLRVTFEFSRQKLYLLVKWLSSQFWVIFQLFILFLASSFCRCLCSLAIHSCWSGLVKLVA